MKKVSLSQLTSFFSGRAYFSKSSIISVNQWFSTLPHEEAIRSGRLLTEDSAKDVRAVKLTPQDCELEVVVKNWVGQDPLVQQRAKNELVARIFAREIIKATKKLEGLAPYLKRITIPPAIVYEAVDRTVLVTDLFKGEHLNTDFLRHLSPDLRALGIILPLLAGAHQFPTSSFLCKGTDRDNVEVGLIDWESIHNEQLEPDYATQVLFCLLASVGDEDGTSDRFKEVLQRSGSNWSNMIRSREFLQLLIEHVEQETGGIGVFTSEEMVRHLLKVAEYYQQRNFTISHETFFAPSSLEDEPEQVKGEELTIDKNYSLSYCGGDAHLLAELINVFLGIYQTQLNDLRSAVKRDDYQVIQRLAHTIKGSVTIFCGQNEPPYLAALELEKIGQRSDAINAEEAFSSLEIQITRLIPALKKLIKEI